MKASYIAILALVLLSACAQTTQDSNTPIQTYTCPDGSVVDDLDDCQTTQEPEQQETSTDEDQSSDSDVAMRTDVFTSDEEQTESVAAELDEMRTRAIEKTDNGYAYTLLVSEDGRAQNTALSGARITIKNEQIAIAFVDEQEYESHTLTHIIGTTDEENATGYCSSCRDVNSTTVALPEITTPFEWLEIQNSEFLGMQTIDGRSSYRISGTYGQEEVIVYADSFSGLPVRVEFGETRIDFKDLSLGARESAFQVE